MPEGFCLEHGAQDIRSKANINGETSGLPASDPQEHGEVSVFPVNVGTNTEYIQDILSSIRLCWQRRRVSDSLLPSIAALPMMRCLPSYHQRAQPAVRPKGRGVSLALCVQQLHMKIMEMRCVFYLNPALCIMTYPGEHQGPLRLSFS